MTPTNHYKCNDSMTVNQTWVTHIGPESHKQHIHAVLQSWLILPESISGIGHSWACLKGEENDWKMKSLPPALQHQNLMFPVGSDAQCLKQALMEVE